MGWGEFETRLRLARNGDSRAETRNPLLMLRSVHDPVSSIGRRVFIGGNGLFWKGARSLKVFWVGRGLVGGKSLGCSRD